MTPSRLPASRPVRAAVAALLAGALLAGCFRPLPEEGSPDALLYAEHCSGCHHAFQPSTLTAKMWEVQMERMDKKYSPVTKPAPTPEERARIFAYLVRNAQK